MPPGTGRNARNLAARDRSSKFYSIVITVRSITENGDERRIFPQPWTMPFAASHGALNVFQMLCRTSSGFPLVASSIASFASGHNVARGVRAAVGTRFKMLCCAFERHGLAARQSVQLHE